MTATSPPTNEQASLARPSVNPMPKPKRPLSAYNLFYRFKRHKIVEALAAAEGDAIDYDAVSGVIAAPPGLEGVPAIATVGASSDAVCALRRARILKNLEGNTDPRDSKARLHRKNQNALNGAMSFVELGRVMNASWKACDAFAKSVFDELYQAGRERYRQRLIKYNAQGQNQGQCEEEPTEAKATPAPAPADKEKPARRRLPMRKYTAAKLTSTPSPPLTGDASDDTSATNQTAKSMVRLTAKCVPPTNGNETEHSSTENHHCAEAPSLSRLSSSKEDIRNGDGAMSSDVAFAASNVAPRDNPTPPCAPLGNVPEGLLVLRLKRLEVQLAVERLRARVRELEAERSRRRLAREVFAQSFLLGNTLRQTMSERGRATMLSRIADLQAMSEVPLKRPSSTMHGSCFPDGIDLDGRPVKKQRPDPLLVARRGWDFE